MKTINPTVTNEVLRKAVHFCWDYQQCAGNTGEIDYSKFLKWYKIYVRGYLERKKRIEHPFHLRTGEPLKSSTLKDYQSRCRGYERDYRAHRLLIRCAVLNGVLGTPGEALKEKIKESFEQWNKDNPKQHFSFKYLDEQMKKLIEKSNKKKNSLSDAEAKAVKYMIKTLELMEKHIELMKKRIGLEIKLGYLPRPSEDNGSDQRKKKIKDLGLNIIDGGKQFEEQPPFAN